MAAWNFVLQFQGAGAGSPPQQCQQFSLPGMPAPCRVLLYACDGASVPSALATHAAIEANLKSRPGVTSSFCSGPGMWGCMTWQEKSCVQMLVPFVGRRISRAVEKDILQWQSRASSLSVITPALLPNVTHAVAFAGCASPVARLNIVNWLGSPNRLAAAVLQRALHLQKPGLFVSYCRNDAAALVDQLYDELSHCGFRVFLDRFSGTPGRYFPHELAEEMADKAVLLVIETPRIRRSRWTLWEIGFAHRYRLGLLALQLPGSPSLSRIVDRMQVTPNSNGTLDPAELASALDFIQRERAIAELRRRAFYEGLGAGAASARGGTVRDGNDGLLELRDASGVAAAIVLPSGKPGQLADVRALTSSPSGTLPKLLLGQHQHLPPQAQADLTWLAYLTTTELLGRYSGY